MNLITIDVYYFVTIVHFKFPLFSAFSCIQSWEWVYGKTPPFSIQRGNKTLSVLVHITRGCVAGVIVRIVSDEILINSIQQLCTSLKGIKKSY